MILSPIGIVSAILMTKVSDSDRTLRRIEQALNVSISDTFWQYLMADIVDELSVCTNSRSRL